MRLQINKELYKKANFDALQFIMKIMKKSQKVLKNQNTYGTR